MYLESNCYSVTDESMGEEMYRRRRKEEEGGGVTMGDGRRGTGGGA